jgi:hypothetical protein
MRTRAAVTAWLAAAIGPALVGMPSPGIGQPGPRVGQPTPEITGGPWIDSEPLIRRLLTE